MSKILIVFSLVFSNTSAFATEICEQYKIPDVFKSEQKIINKKIFEFSQKKEIAQKSDEILMKLVKMKSQILKDWMDKREFKNGEEDQIAREWRLYYAKNFILSKYPSGDVGVGCNTQCTAFVAFFPACSPYVTAVGG